MADRNSKDQKKLQRDVRDSKKEFTKDSKEAQKERKDKKKKNVIERIWT